MAGAARLWKRLVCSSSLFTSTEGQLRGNRCDFKRPLISFNAALGERVGRRGAREGGCIDCLGLKAVNLFFPLSLLGHFYWRDEGRQSTAPQLALLLEVNDPVSSSWLHFPTFCRHQDPSPCQVHSVPWSSANASQITM